MTERNKKLDEIANQLDENILAVKGTLELVDTSVTEDELHQLLLKAIDRMDIVQRLSEEMLAALKNCFDRMGDMKE
jgi:DNA-binding FrmR family transcriptional regulator